MDMVNAGAFAARRRGDVNAGAVISLHGSPIHPPLAAAARYRRRARSRARRGLAGHAGSSAHLVRRTEGGVRRRPRDRRRQPADRQCRDSPLRDRRARTVADLRARRPILAVRRGRPPPAGRSGRVSPGSLPGARHRPLPPGGIGVRGRRRRPRPAGWRWTGWRSPRAAISSRKSGPASAAAACGRAGSCGRRSGAGPTHTGRIETVSG